MTPEPQYIQFSRLPDEQNNTHNLDIRRQSYRITNPKINTTFNLVFYAFYCMQNR
jgi:hypothetical protein